MRPRKAIATLMFLAFACAAPIAQGQDWWDIGRAPEPSTSVKDVEFTPESQGKTLSLTDWAGGRIVVKAAGAADLRTSANMAQARLMAEEAARAMVALKIAEIVKGLRVTSTTTISKAMTESQIVQTRVDAFITGIRYSEPRTVQQPDGSIIVEVIGGLGLFGDNGLLKQAPELIPGASAPEMRASLPPPKAESGDQNAQAVPSVPSEKAEPPEPNTGVIVDATGLPVRPGLAPRILNETKREVYGTADVPRDYVINQGMVGYAATVEDARKNTDRVGKNPLVVKAVRPDEKNGVSVVISSEDAGKVLAADRDTRALKEARVIFVLR